MSTTSKKIKIQSKSNKNKFNAPVPYDPHNYDFVSHREFIELTGSILSGRRAIQEDDTVVYVYKAPHQDTYNLGGTYIVTEQGVEDCIRVRGKVYLESEEGKRRELLAIVDQDSVLDYLNDLLHLVEVERRKVSMEGNRKLETSRREHATPPGAIGHLVKEYDRIVDLIKHEYFHQKDKRKQTTTYTSR